MNFPPGIPCAGIHWIWKCLKEKKSRLPYTTGNISFQSYLSFLAMEQWKKIKLVTDLPHHTFVENSAYLS